MCGIWCPGGFSYDSIHVYAETELLFAGSTITVDRRTCTAVQRPTIVLSTKWIGAPVPVALIELTSADFLNPARRLGPGANPWRVVNQIWTRIRTPAAPDRTVQRCPSLPYLHSFKGAPTNPTPYTTNTA